MKPQPFFSESSRILVMKFGGTSVGNADAIRSTAEIVAHCAEYRKNLVVVVSAMRGMTEALLASACFAEAGDVPGYLDRIKFIEKKNLEVIRELFPCGEVRLSLEDALASAREELRGYCERLRAKRAAEPALVDAVSSLGERLNARIVSAQLRESGLASRPVEATNLIVTDRAFMNASPLERPTRRLSRRVLQPLFAAGIVPVVTGFIGAALDGQITTLGRGGSDYSATILGAGLDAEEVWIWTDVAGVMTADPRLVPEAAVVSRIGYAEVHELANFGGRVLHPKTILPVLKRNIPIRVRHTFNPAFPGTLIARDESARASEELIVTLLSGCRWDDGSDALLNGSGSALPHVAISRPFSHPEGPVSVVSLVGKSACKEALRESSLQKLVQNNVEVFGTSQTAARNRFSLVVPDASAHIALRMLHNEVVYL